MSTAFDEVATTGPRALRALDSRERPNLTPQRPARGWQ
jgi:hypothetical protein